MCYDEETLDAFIKTIKIENDRRIALGESKIRTPGVKEKDRKIRMILGILTYHNKIPKLLKIISNDK